MGTAPQRNNNLFFDKNFTNSFSESVIKTLGTMANLNATAKKPSISKRTELKGDVVGVINIHSGTFNGIIFVCFPKHTIFKIVEGLVGETHADVNSHVIDAVGEITNMIYGQTKTALNQLGFEFKTAFPTVAVPPFENVLPIETVSLHLPFSINDDYPFSLDIAVRF